MAMGRRARWDDAYVMHLYAFKIGSGMPAVKGCLPLIIDCCLRCAQCGLSHSMEA